MTPLADPAPGTPLACALVTGAARGIGAAVATRLAQAGIPVALLDRDDSVTDTAQHLQTAARVPVLSLVADVAASAEVDAAVDRVEATLGPIAVLANVAGVLRTGRILDADDTDWQTCMAVNATGIWNTGRVVGRRMHARGTGSIVTVASNAASVPRVGMGMYAASKAAAVALTRGLGIELAPHVRCNVVCPGSTDTAMQRALWPDPTDGSGAAAVIEGDLAQHRLGIPLRRLAEPADIADAVVFLAGPTARHITMQVLTVDGGATLGV